MLKFGRVLRWKASNFFLGGIFPGITISYIKQPTQEVRLRADGFVIVSAHGSYDGIPISMVNPALAVELINAQQWPWETPINLQEVIGGDTQ